MANDIVLCISGQPIKNGTMLVQSKVTGPTEHDKYNRYVSNKPAIEDIENKYQDRFDDRSYYFGGLTGDVLGA